MVTAHLVGGSRLTRQRFKVTRLLSRRMGFPVALVLGVNVTRARISSGLGIPPLSSSRSPLRRSS